MIPEVVINNQVRHGKPVINGTRITVDEVFEMLEAGLSYEEIKREYGLTKEQVLSVIRYVSSMVKGEEVHKMPS